VVDALAVVKERIRNMRPEWKAALKRARTTPREQGIIGIPGLEGTTFPDEVASAANRFISAPPKGAKKVTEGFLNGIEAFNNLYRGMRATMDLSAPGIQGWLGLASDPVGYVRAMNLMFHSLGDPRVLGRFIDDFDTTAGQAGRLGSDIWARAGLRMGGADTEFMLGRGVTAGLGRVPGIKQANRAFGFFGDSQRLSWADELLEEALRGGKTLQQLTASGDVERIARTVNNMTGWAEGKAFGSVGDLLLFAPRFLQSRLNTLAKGAAGLRPGAGLEQRIARRSLLRMFGSMTLTTVALNELLGNDTDFAPFLDDNLQPTFTPTSRKNPNFMRVRWQGRDWSLFGTWDSILGAIVSTAGGRPDLAARSMGSGALQNTWNLVTERTFMGEEVSARPSRVVEDPMLFGRVLMENLVPFAAEEAGQAAQKVTSGVTQGDVSDVVEGVVTMVGEGFGIKSTTLSPSEARDIVRQQIMVERGLTRGPTPPTPLTSQKGFDEALGFDPNRATPAMLPQAVPERTFLELDGDVRRDIDSDPRVQEKTKVLFDRRRLTGSPYQAYLDERTDLDAKFDQDVNDLLDLFARSRGGLLKKGEEPVFGRAFRERLSELQRDRSRDKDDLRGAHAEALKFLEDLDPSTNEFDIAQEAYFKAVSAPELEDPVSGSYDFGERDRRLAALRQEWGSLTIDRIEADMRRNEHPLIAQLRRDRVVMEPYFELVPNFMRAKGLEDLHKDFLNLDPALKKHEIENPKFTKLRKAFATLEVKVKGKSARQLWLMAQDPEIDRLLVKWGYRSNATHKDVVSENIRRLVAQPPGGLGDLNIPLELEGLSTKQRQELRELIEPLVVR
jgi:hypothetical protein